MCFKIFNQRKPVDLEKNTVRTLTVNQWMNNDQDFTDNCNSNLQKNYKNIANLKLFIKDTTFDWYKIINKSLSTEANDQ